MDTFNEPPIDSATTGLPNPTEGDASAIGRPLGGTGSAKTRRTFATFEEALRVRGEEERAERRRAIEDAEWSKVPLRLLKRSKALVPEILIDRGFPSWLVADLPPSLGEEQCSDLPEALADAEHDLIPAGPEATAILLAKLAVVLIVPDTEHEMMMATYIEDLQDVPGHVLEDACRTWRRRNKFWPTIAELLELCQPDITACRLHLNWLYSLDSVRRNPAPGRMVTEDWYLARKRDAERAMLSRPCKPAFIAGP